MEKVFLATTIICGAGWWGTWFLLLTLVCYTKKKDCNPSKEELRDCAEIVLRKLFKIVK